MIIEKEEKGTTLIDTEISEHKYYHKQEELKMFCIDQALKSHNELNKHTPALDIAKKY